MIGHKESGSYSYLTVVAILGFSPKSFALSVADNEAKLED